MKYILLIISLLLLGACSVKKAGAPTAPPQTEKTIFNAAELTGAFCQTDRPKMFLWPIEKNGIELTYDEKADSRQKINKFNDLANENIEIRDLNQEKLDVKYLPLIEASESEFTAMKCYSYCDPLNFLCDPTDDTVTEIGEGDWAVGADEEEQEKIALCQENQSERSVIIEEFKEKIALEVTPFNTKAAEASQTILNEIGDENYLDVPELQYTFMDGRLIVTYTLDGQIFSTEHDDPLFKITAAKMDVADGYLSFNANALDVEDDNRIYGQIRFDLEFISNGPTKRLDGDFILDNFDDKSERIGRVASSGYVSSEGTCD